MYYPLVLYVPLLQFKGALCVTVHKKTEKHNGKTGHGGIKDKLTKRERGRQGLQIHKCRLTSRIQSEA